MNHHSPLLLGGLITSLSVFCSIEAIEPGTFTTHISVAPKQTTMFQLPSNPTTGYSWVVTNYPHNNPAAKIIKTHYKPQSTGLKNNKPLVGAGGTMLYTIKGMHKGSSRFTFEYKRVFEKNVPPVRVEHLFIMVE